MGCRVLILAALWILLAAIAAGIGLLILDALAAMTLARPADRLFFAAWLGIATLAWCAFVAALVMPLRAAAPWMGAAALVAGASGLLRSHRVLRAVRMRAWLLFVALALVIAERSVAVGNLEDTGGYHWSMVQWYGAYGVPAGLGLFQWRLATHSAWLALTAFFDGGVLESRVATLANGLLFLGCTWFFVVCAVRWIRGRATLADRFAVGALAFLLQLIGKWEMRLSPSPDIPVLLASVVVCWKLLADNAPPHADNSHDSFAAALLAVAAVSFKLNALPLAVVAGGFWFFQMNQTWRVRFAGLTLLTFLIAPVAIASWISTGCPLFPATFGCTEGPSAVGVSAVRRYAAIIGATARHDIDAGLLLAALALAILWWKRRWLPADVFRGPVAIAVAGIAFTAWIAPTMRFAAGYLTILPALAFATLTTPGRFAPRLEAAMRTGLVAALALAIAVPLYKEFIYPSLRARPLDSWAERKRGEASINAPAPEWWLIPNRIDYGGPFAIARAADFEYAVSPQMTCWNHPLPCASNPPLSALPDVRLRDPSRGFAGGFVRGR